MPLLFVRLMENPPAHNFIPKNYFLQTFPQVARISLRFAYFQTVTSGQFMPVIPQLSVHTGRYAGRRILYFKTQRDRIWLQQNRKIWKYPMVSGWELT
jgi:hypothetical protein